MVVTICNQYPNIELISPICFCNDGTYHEYPVKRMNASTMMKIGFRLDPDQDESVGILMYKVQRKESVKFDHLPSTDITPIKTVEDTSEIMRLLVVWKIKHHDMPKIHIALVKHGNNLVLNEDKLVHLHDKIYDILRLYTYKRTWLMSDNAILAATHELVYKEDFELKITISEGIEEDWYTMAPLWIDSERQVSSLMMWYNFTNLHR
jgi:hypothetical protein